MRQLQRGIGQQFSVTLRHAAAFIRPILQMLQFHAKHGTLNSLHAVIVSDLVVIVARAGTVFTQRTGSPVKLHAVLRYHERAAFAAGPEILAGIETETRHRAE